MKNKLTRLLSLALSLVLCLSLLPAAAFAATEYTITFSAGAGTGTRADETVAANGWFTFPDSTGLTAPTSSTSYPYTLYGWEITCSNPIWNGCIFKCGGRIQVEADLTLTAVWETTKKCSICFKCDYGISYENNVVVEHSSVTDLMYDLPAYTYGYDSKRGGDTLMFTGWRPGGSSSGTVKGVSIAPNIESLEFTAVYQDCATITYNANSGSSTMAEERIALDTTNNKATYTFPECTFTAPAGKIFKCWNVEGNDKYKGDFQPGATLTLEKEKITVTANWEDGATIHYDSNGGTGTMEDTQIATTNNQATCTVPECTFTAPAGMVFSHWELVGFEGSEIAPGGPMGLTNTEYTLKAVWVDCATFTYDAGEGSGSMDPVTVPSSGNYTFPACSFTAPEGKTFSHWLLVDTGVTVQPGDSVSQPSGNITVKAVWKYKYATFTYDADGGTGTMDATQIEADGKYTFPECTFTAPEGTKFDHWEIGDEPGSTFAPGDKLDSVSGGEYMVIAVWTELENSVFTFDANGGTGSMEIAKIVEGSDYTLPECAFTAPEGKMFSAWELSSDPTKPYYPGDKLEAVSAGEYTVKAKWGFCATFTFDANGGTGTMEPETILSSQNYTFPACGFTAPAGKTFSHWQLGDNTDKAYAPGDSLDRAVGSFTVKAVWKDLPKVEYEITAGADSTWTKGTTLTLSFTSNAEFAKFDSVKVDGTLVDAKNYTAEKGSTKITLKAAYLETLSVGKHTITIVSTDGEAASKFTVKAADDTPKTGDSRNTALWAAMLAACSIGMAAVTVCGKKKKF